MVLKGKIELSCGDEKFIVEEGDSIYCAVTQKLKKVVNIAGTRSKTFLDCFFISLLNLLIIKRGGK